MVREERYEQDLLFFFDGRPAELGLYLEFYQLLERELPQASVKVRKSQIGFYGRHLFAAVSLPLRRRRQWPEKCVLITFGLHSRLDSPRIAAAVEPYPGRWTHHVVVSGPEQIDGELMGWVLDAYDFSEIKGRRTK